MSTRWRGSLAVAGAMALLASLPGYAQPRGDCRGMRASGSHGVVAGADEPGERLWVEGRVVDRDGAPLAGVEILVYQTGDDGYYSIDGRDERDARLCVVIVTGEDGTYSLDTIRPGAYPTGGVPEHIHFELRGAGLVRQRADLQFADDEKVSASRKRNLTPFSTVQPVERDDAGVWRARRDFRLER